MASLHESVEQFISDIVKTVRDDIGYYYARTSDFNSIPDKKKVCFTLDPLNNTEDPNASFTTTFPIKAFVYMLDKKDGSEKDYKDILNKTAEIKEKFTRKLHRLDTDEDITLDLSTDRVSTGAIQSTAAIRVTSDCFTGWILEFNLTVPDIFDYCSIYDS